MLNIGDSNIASLALFVYLQGVCSGCLKAPVRVSLIVYLRDGHHHRTAHWHAKHKGEECHDYESTAYRAEGPNRTVLNSANPGEDSCYTAGY